MTEKEIELAMQRLFSGASKVRAHKYKYAKNVSSEFKKELTERIPSQMWNKRKNNLKVA